LLFNLFVTATTQGGRPEMRGTVQFTDTASTTTGAIYTLGSNPAERERLRRQTLELDEHAQSLLSAVDAGPGSKVVDLGCGPSGSIEALARHVGPAGRVVAVDSDGGHVALARELARRHGLENVDVLQADARRTQLEASSFDLAHARLLLINIPDPAEVVTEMVRLVRPGGFVACEEADMGVRLCEPPNAACARLAELFESTYRSVGADPRVGRRLPEMLRRAGLSGIGVSVRADVYPLGHSRRPILADLVRSLRPRIIEGGFADPAELDELDLRAREHLGDPTTLFMSGYFQAWGRKECSFRDEERQG
jgi:ubiquinone/menaquinone biosynthesis C-methylase UbiE